METNSLREVIVKGLEPFIDDIELRHAAGRKIERRIDEFMARMPPDELLIYTARNVDMARHIAMCRGDGISPGEAYNIAMKALVDASGRGPWPKDNLLDQVRATDPDQPLGPQHGV